MPPQTPLYRLVEAKLRRRPIDFIDDLRFEQYPPLPYVKISQEIQRKTGIYVSHEAVRRWYLIAIGQVDPSHGGTVAA